MSITVNLHPFLVHIADNQEIIEVSGSNVGEVLNDMVSRFPDLREWLFEKDGNINNLLEIYVNGESAYPEELASPVKDGDELQTVIIITGG